LADNIERASQYPDTPEGWAQRWEVELAAADEEVEKWHNQGKKVEKRYLDERDNDIGSTSRLNLFHGDVETRKALIYGNPPQGRCRRRFADAMDDEARVSAEMLERLLNADIERDEDNFALSLEMARDDRLLPGLGVNRYRYTVEGENPTPAQQERTDPVTGAVAPAVPERPQKADEDVESDYVHWQDFRWSPSRTWDEVRWVAFKACMSRDALHKRFDDTLGKDRVESIPLTSKKKNQDDADKKADPWSRAEVWEVWSKEQREVFWVVRGFDVVLDRQPDPLGLARFFPCQRPMFANATNSKLLPRPDFVLAQDLYNEIDRLTTRIGLLEDAVKVVGFYNGEPDIARAMQGKENTMVPVKNWAMFAEKGGAKGAVDWFPLEMVVNALGVLGEKRLEKIQLLHQVTGMSDAMRGEGASNVTATQRRIEARAAGTRTRAAQAEFARFATDGLKIRAEIIAKHFDEQTIITRSNILRTKDAELAPRAAQLIKQDVAQYRIEISTDTLAQTDYEAIQGESMQFMQALTTGLQQIVEIAPVAPMAVPELLQLMQAGLAGFRAAQRMEGIFDTLVAKAQQAAEAAQAQPPQADPKLEAEKVKAGAEQFRAQADVQKTQMDMRAAQAQHQMDMQKMAAQVQANQIDAATRVAEAQAKPKEEAPV